MNNVESMAVGIAVGAGLMYFLDADRGGRRRALLRDQVAHAEHELEDRARSTARHGRNRARGVAHDLRAGHDEADTDDRVLAERVRSEIGRDVENARTIDVVAHDSSITLSGTVHSDELQRVVRKARSVRGVDHVDNQLAVED